MRSNYLIILVSKGNYTMKFKLVIFDVDGTLTKGDNSWKLIHSSLNVYEQAKKHRELFFNHEISYQEWANRDVGLWKNTPVKKIAETVAFLKRKKYKLALLSSGITLLTDKLKEKFGFHYSIANHVCTNDSGLLTGRIECKVGFYNKDAAIQGILREMNMDHSECIAIGDDENDISLFQKVGLSIAFNPINSRVASVADVTIRGSDLRKILKYIP